MLPILFSIGKIKIYTYGVFLTLGFFWGLFFIWKNIRLTSYSEEKIFDGVFLSLFGALFFARFFYVLANFKSFGFSFLKFILINGYPGLSLYGALFGGVLTLYLFSLVNKIRFSYLVDYLNTGLLVALGFGKLGAFLSGSEVGTKTLFFLRVNYLGYSGERHITGLYESLIFFIAAYVSYRLLLAVRREDLPEGFVFVFSLLTISATYFFLDPLKKAKFYLFGLNFNRGISFVLMLTSLGVFVYHFREEIFLKVKSFVLFIGNYGSTIIKTASRKIQESSFRRKIKVREGDSAVKN